MSRKIDRLMQAMAEHEGWSPVGSSTAPNGSRAYRHHNPGNLRASPFAASVVDNFAVFRSDDVGWMAFHWDIMQKARGNTSTGLGPESTIAELIRVWAPPADGNDSDAYIKSVVAKSGLPAEMKLRELLEN